MSRPKSSPLINVIKGYRIYWAFFTVILYIAAIATVFLVFPDVSNLWVSIFVLASGFTASLTALGDMLVGAEESEHEQEEKNDEEPPGEAPQA